MAIIEGTKAAFLEMISRRGVYKYLGVDRSTVSNWKRFINDPDKGVSLNKMEEMLDRYGAKVIKEKIWEVGEPNSK